MSAKEKKRVKEYQKNIARQKSPKIIVNKINFK